MRVLNRVEPRLERIDIEAVARFVEPPRKSLTSSPVQGGCGIPVDGRSGADSVLITQPSRACRGLYQETDSD